MSMNILLSGLPPESSTGTRRLQVFNVYTHRKHEPPQLPQTLHFVCICIRYRFHARDWQDVINLWLLFSLKHIWLGFISTREESPGKTRQSNTLGSKLARYRRESVSLNRSCQLARTRQHFVSSLLRRSVLKDGGGEGGERLCAEVANYTGGYISAQNVCRQQKGKI